MAINSPKHSQETWTALRAQFVSGNYKTLKQLSSQYGVHPNTLRSRIYNEKWSDKQSALLDKVEQKVQEKVVSKAEAYLEKSFLIGQKYEALIDKSLDSIGDVIDPDSLDTFTRSSLRAHELCKSSLRIPTVASVDVTTKGQSIGESIVSAISKLRDGSPPKLTNDQVASYIDVEILPKASGSS